MTHHYARAAGTLACALAATALSLACDSGSSGGSGGGGGGGGGGLCGNGALDPGEECDSDALDGATCASLGEPAGTLACADDCTYDIGACGGGGNVGRLCGDGVIQLPEEECDGGNLGGQDCNSRGYIGGELWCTQTCRFNEFFCVGSTADCGDGLAEGPEPCDGSDLRGHTCQTEGYATGSVGCTATCELDLSACVGSGPTCGDGVAHGDERCDGADVRGLTCTDYGFLPGVVACFACILDFTDCDILGVPATCGDGVAEPTETCDGADLHSQSCASLGAGAGELACTGDCRGFSFAGCAEQPECGDDVTDAGEICDGGTLDCTSFGYAGGGPAPCLPTCGGYDLSACTGPPPNCGNGNAQGRELCDGADLRGLTCPDLGYTGGVLACASNCALDASACTL